ncbi:hypothetical protein FQN60_013800 [Etheostoma spectabile]|uniref:Uncharacterized protein n=1 Tax=Etheostoma spectabile TaxID=54343 RepID=A0A5J5CFX0_9PERO|nr:hypothetical protein FQN60_013800 [Etheostoma spectabile]
MPEQNQTFAHRLLPPRTHLPCLHQGNSQTRATVLREGPVQPALLLPVHL